MNVDASIPNPETWVCVLPPQVIFLGEALAPVARHAVVQTFRKYGRSEVVKRGAKSSIEIKRGE